MSTEQNKAIARKFFEILETGDLEAADEIVAPDYVNRKAIPGQTPGRKGYKEVVKAVQSGIPDIKYTIEDQIAEGDQVVTRYSARGTHQGTFLGVAATGNSLTITALVQQRIVNGKVQESWLEWDLLGLMQQMGATLAPFDAKR